ncbi:MAG TPA: hypothetical protein VNZ52_04165 [Candidatus Thermoplasmatota archaeon]|nr:hypothetical protein [Candidatus Thermoplasmatota archaeon]
MMLALVLLFLALAVAGIVFARKACSGFCPHVARVLVTTLVALAVVSWRIPA